ncbi:DUF1573 domain-containing protein [bacterium]|nr:DUF1573 domain-containing protein [bacterium]
MRVLLILLSLVLAPLVSCQDALISEAATPAEILPGLVVSEIEYDFGEIFFGQPVSHEFVLTNVGQESINILNIRMDCGCSARSLDKSPIEPNSSRSLNIIFEPEFRTGKVSKRITVYTDIVSPDSPGRWFEFTLKSSITSLVKLEPGHVYFKKVNAGKPSTETVLITAIKDKTVTIVKAETSSEHLDTKLTRNDIQAGKPVSWTLELTLKETAPVGRFSDTVILTTDSDLQQALAIDVLGFVRGVVSVRPTQCYLGTLNPGETIEKTFVVSEAGSETTLREPSILKPPEWLQYTVETETENKRYKVQVKFTIPENQVGRFGGEFTIDIGHDSLKEFEIPVFGYILTSELAEKMDKKETPESDDSGVSE